MTAAVADLELAGVAERLENLAVVIGDCKFHASASLLLDICQNYYNIAMTYVNIMGSTP